MSFRVAIVVTFLLVVQVGCARGELLELGCFRDDNERVLPEMVYQGDSLTLEFCQQECKSRGFAYYGAQWSKQCFCGNGPYDALGAADNCNKKCSGDASQICGGDWANSVGSTGSTGSPTSSPSPRPSSSPTSNPSPSPSESPSSSPSTSPTFKPTQSPISTTSPSSAPTRSPVPTLEPTQSPSSSPTFPCLDLMENGLTYNDGTPAPCKDLHNMCEKYQVVRDRCPVSCGMDCDQRPYDRLPTVEESDMVQLPEDPPSDTSKTQTIIAVSGSLGFCLTAMLGLVLFRERRRRSTDTKTSGNSTKSFIESLGLKPQPSDREFQDINPIFAKLSNKV